jgi:hypothetical protein
MSFEVEPSLSRSTSRRTIVRTGAKLAYAAPLVAASMRMQSAGANGVISGGPTCEAGSVLVHGGCFRYGLDCESVCGDKWFLIDPPIAVCAVGSIRGVACNNNDDCPVGQACDDIFLTCVTPC